MSTEFCLFSILSDWISESDKQINQSDVKKFLFEPESFDGRSKMTDCDKMVIMRTATKSQFIYGLSPDRNKYTSLNRNSQTNN